MKFSLYFSSYFQIITLLKDKSLKICEIKKILESDSSCINSKDKASINECENFHILATTCDRLISAQNSNTIVLVMKNSRQ